MRRLKIACVILFSALIAPFLFAADTLIPQVENGMAWYDLAKCDVEGRGWKDTESPFTRIPERLQEKVTPGVWRHSRNSTGLFVRFKTDATLIRVRHEVSGPLAMAHMPAVGTSGVDLYARDDHNNWRWAASSMPEEKKYDQVLLSDISAQMREFLLYFPLHNTTVSLSLGVPEEACLEMLPPCPSKPIVYYGTSIVHGGCASRPGMSSAAILGRRLERPVVNLGFSGSGRMERDMAGLIAEIDAAVYVVDCLPNMGIEEVAERTEPFIRTLRQARPDTPILLVEDRSFSNAWIKKELLAEHQARRAALMATYEKLASEGMTNLYYLKGDHLLGEDDEATVDGSHLSDLGMFRMAGALETLLRDIVRHRKIEPVR